MNNNKVNSEITEILKPEINAASPVIRERQLEGLPPAVAGWLKASGIIGKERINTVYLRQQGQMKMKPGQKRWYKADAEQYFSVNHPAFVWHVKMNIPPFIPIIGRDRFADGKGEMQIKAFGVLSWLLDSGLWTWLKLEVREVRYNVTGEE